MTEESDFVNQIHDDKNKNNIKCQYCGSLMLKTKSGTYSEHKFQMPLMHQKRQIIEIESEELDKFWCVDDMFTFENIGFSNTIQQTKLLICADCDMGPVGYHDLCTKKSYIALARVKHDHEK